MHEILRGDLRFVRFTSLLQLADAEGIDGTLELGAGALLTLSRGGVCAARCGRINGLDALLTLFFLSSGTFRLVADPVEPAPPLAPLMRVLLEGARLLDEWGRIGPMVLAPATPTEPSGRPISRVLAALDGRRAVQEIVVQLRVSPVECVDELADELERGAVRAVAPERAQGPWPGLMALGAPDPEPPPPVVADPGGPVSFEAAITEGRRLLRAGRLDEAERRIHEALSLRPDDPIARQNLRRIQIVRAEGGASLSSWLRPRAGATP